MCAAKPVKIAILILASLLFGHFSKAQTLTKKQTDSLQNTRAQNIYFELLGAGITFSANYDARFAKTRDGLGARIGIGYLDNNKSTIVSVPIQINYLIGENNKFFEAGAGATYLAFSGIRTSFLTINNRHTSTSSIVGVGTFGYRYQPANGGLSFRVSFNPILDVPYFYPYIGTSLGYTF